jgi:uncharacterized protein YuzE
MIQKDGRIRRWAPIAEMDGRYLRDILLPDEDTLLDIDQHGNICGITIEHASQRADVPRFSYEQIAA